MELSNLQVEITSNEYAEWREIYKTSDHQKINGFSRHAHDTVIEPVVFSFKTCKVNFYVAWSALQFMVRGLSLIVARSLNDLTFAIQRSMSQLGIFMGNEEYQALMLRNTHII